MTYTWLSQIWEVIEIKVNKSLKVNTVNKIVTKISKGLLQGSSTSPSEMNSYAV